MAEEHNENFIRNLAEDYKNVIDEKEKKYQKLVRQHNEIFKVMCVMYSTFRQLDTAFSQMDIEGEGTIFGAIHSMLEFGRSESSQALHKYLPIEEELEDPV